MTGSQPATNILLLVLFSYAIFASLVNAQVSTGKRNSQFVVDRNRVLAFDTEIVPIGPYLSSISVGAGQLRWAQSVVASKVSSMSIHIQIKSTRGGDIWELRFSSGGVVQDVIRSDSDRGRQSEAWSSDITGNVVLVELVANTPPTGLSIKIDEYDHPITPTVPQGVYGKNEMQSILAMTGDIRKLGTSVARLRIKTSRGQALCTGFLISENLILTNYHCIATNTEAANTLADFGYDTGGQALQTFRVEKIEVTNSDLAYDYVVARVSKSPGKNFSHISVKYPGTTSFGNQLSRQLFLIEHPGGGPKEVSMKDCAVIQDKIPGVDSSLQSDFGHHCDTLGGSSGSPVFSQTTNELVGLHHMGFEDASKPEDPLQNQAVYIGFILEDIKAQSPGIFAEIFPAKQ